MKIYDTDYGPDTFYRIRRGHIKRMYLTYTGYERPVAGDMLRVRCLYQGVVRDKFTMKIAGTVDIAEQPLTVLISLSGRECSDLIEAIADNDSGWFYNGTNSLARSLRSEM